MPKTQKILKKGEATPTIASTQKKGFVAVAQARLARLERKTRILSWSLRKSDRNLESDNIELFPL
jgi:hypothetical protein